ncbi:MAG: PP2C family protein-serine/threonine phosphatase, partial [Methylotenera sp.]
MVEKQKKNSIGRSVEYSVPCVRELTQTVKPITLNTPILDILHLFQTNADLSALPVMDDDNKYFGIISRRHYLNLMTRAFARELYARKNLFILLESNSDIFVAPLIVDAEDRIDQVMVEFLKRDPGIMYDALPVISNNGIMGVVKVADMMLKLSQSQGKLIGVMQQLSARLNEEVANAATLQRNLLRPAQIELPGLRGLSTMITSSEVGGDFYDYYAVDGRWMVILVGDVSGHGIAAGTIVCAAKAGVNFLETENEKEPHKILSRLSNIIFNTAHQSLLMTMFAICIDTRTGEVRYANAGHQFAYLYRSMLGRLDTLEVGGLPLGKNEATDYEEVVTEIDLGDRLFLYTDSIVEEENSEGECFGYERLEELLVNQADNDIETLSDNLLESLTTHLGRHSFTDDLTIFCVEHVEKTSDIGHQTINTIKSDSVHLEPAFIVDSIYRTNPEAISPRIMRQDLIFLAEKDFSDLIPSLSAQGVRRVLLQDHPINLQLGWGTLLNQHLKRCNDDLAMFLRNPDQRREFHFSHSEDKAFIINEVEAWLQEMSLPNPD